MANLNRRRKVASVKREGVGPRGLGGPGGEGGGDRVNTENSRERVVEEDVRREVVGREEGGGENTVWEIRKRW